MEGRVDSAASQPRAARSSEVGSRDGFFMMYRRDTERNKVESVMKVGEIKMKS